ncbi:MAG: hypothetical protein HY906_03410 [Deltaproteobacteria bacterium]|nr:hypothetical protein [Deltaproteobacteria bacterium]
MERVLLGYRRHLLPIPWALFKLVVGREAARTGRVLGGLDDEQRRVHHFVVRDLPRLARPMPPEHIAAALDLPLGRVIPILDELERRLIFLFRPGGRDVVWAYPVTVAETPHRLTFSTGERLNAACGTDAVATPFVQGRLRGEALSFEIGTECACCGAPIHFTMRHDLSYTLADADSRPMFFVPMVNFARLKAPSIIDDF